METRSRRRTWLTILAVGNLIIWLTLAATVGLLASDTVDIGAESLFREFQATAGAVLEELPRQITGPGSGQGASLSTGDGPNAVGDGTSASEGVDWPDSVGSSQASGDAGDPQVLAPADSPGPVAQGPGAVREDQPDSPPGSSETPSRSGAGGLILLADPEWAEYSTMDSELRASAEGRPVQIRYNEATLNRRIAELLASYPEQPYNKAVVDLERDAITVTGDVTVLGFEVSTEVEGTVSAANCLPQVSIRSVKVAGLLTPGFVKDGVKDLIVDSLNQYPANHPLCLEQFVIEKDRVTVYGSRR